VLIQIKLGRLEFHGHFTIYYLLITLADNLACKPIAPMKLQSSHQISKPTNICDCRKMCSRAGLRHVRGVRPNRAADFRGPPFWTL